MLFHLPCRQFDLSLLVFPGVFIILSSLSFNLVGDGLTDALDPKLKD